MSGLVLTQVLKLYSPKALVVTDLKQKNLDLALKYGGRNKQPPLATKKLLEVTDGLRRPPP